MGEEESWFYDVHCHVFNRREINIRLISQILTVIPELIPDSLSRKGSDERKRNRAKNRELIRKMQNFMKLSMTGTHQDVFNRMKGVYGSEIRIVPLMFDIEQAFNGIRFPREPEPGDSAEITRQKDEERIRRGIARYRSRIGKLMSDQMKERTRKLVPDKFRDLEALQLNLTDYVTRFRQRRQPDRDSYDIQLLEILKLKSDFPDRVFPFLSVDPRRPALIRRFMEDEAFRQHFSGIKLYTPTGYSPTDPEFMAPGGLYEFCAARGIPVTAHHSYAGFATPLESVEISGDVFLNGEVTPVNGPVSFTKALTPRWVQDRADKLNHPELWRKVIETYPALKLNLAHFSHQNPEWQELVISMISADNNLYTDLSCFYKRDELVTLRERFFTEGNNLMANRLLYGSDFYLNLLFTSSFEDYYRNFREVFSEQEFNHIARANPERFLGI